MYNPKSLKAEEFISQEEILETLKYAEENKVKFFSKLLSASLATHIPNLLLPSLRTCVI